MLNYEYPPVGGGASPITGALANQLGSTGNEVDVVTMHFRGLPRFEAQGGVRVYRVPAWRRSQFKCGNLELLSYLPGALIQALALARRKPYDLIHAHFILPTGAVAVPLGRLLRIPTVLTIHGSDVPGYNPDRFSRSHRLLRPAWQQLVRGATAIISPSKYLGGLLQQQWPAHVDVIPYGFTPATLPSIPRRKQILAVSRLFPRKGVQYLLEALASLPLAGWEITVAGDGPMLPLLREQAHRLKLPVNFTGFIKGAALEALYASSAIFAFPSLQDNFPVVLLEAMSAGCAVVTSDASGMPEVVAGAGVLVPPGDVAALRKQIKRLMENEDERLQYGAAARTRVSELSWSVIGRQHEQLYQRVLSGAS